MTTNNIHENATVQNCSRDPRAESTIRILRRIELNCRNRGNTERADAYKMAIETIEEEFGSAVGGSPAHPNIA